MAFAHSNTRIWVSGRSGGCSSVRTITAFIIRLNGPQDVNLGFALSIWDQLFHRAIFPSAATVGIDTGLPGRPLVVEQSAERPRHLSVFAAQFVAPFRPMHSSDLPPSRHRIADQPNHSEGAVGHGGDLPHGAQLCQ